MKKSYKHIIWDWNGTLFNDVELCLDILNNLLRNNNLPTKTVDFYRDIFTFPVRDYYAKAGFNLDVLSFEKLGQEWMNEYQQRRLEGGLHDGVQEILTKFNMNNIEQSILSAYKHDTLLEIVNHFNLQHYFTHLTGLDNIYASSKVNLGKDLMKKLVNFNCNVLLIGDTVHDFDVAMEIGCDCILIANGHQSKEKLEKCGVKVFDNLAKMMKNAAFMENGFNI